ncbi:MAG: class I SAM-dependent methyltransferase [Phycisphaeraceae bacterium]|nr:class I SAM-dependent methyltransferase [Phycisphaeraceae bacterium]
MAGIIDSVVRRAVPSLPPLTRSRAAMLPLDAIDYLSRSLSPELKNLPPNRLRLRTGVGNRLLGNSRRWLSSGRRFWEEQHGAGRVKADSSIIDLGCGCGRCAIALKMFGLGGEPFRGRYTGLDVDREMLEWCTHHLASDHFRFGHVPARSTVYNPSQAAVDSGRRLFDADSDSADFLFAISVFSHLVEEDFRTHLAECRRVLRGGATLLLTTFCMEHVVHGLSERWSFRHRMGAAFVESLRYPEAATGYELAWILESARNAGFSDAAVSPSASQTCFVFRAV